MPDTEKKTKKPTVTLALTQEVYRYIVRAAAEDRRTPAMWTTIYLEDGISRLIDDISSTPDRQGA